LALNDGNMAEFHTVLTSLHAVLTLFQAVLTSIH
jgi:hypothetical protein